MKLATNLQRYRRLHDLSQEELAEKCQVSRQAIAKWESGESVPTLEKLIFLADLYKVCLDELVGRENDIEIFGEFMKHFVPQDIHFGETDDVLPVVIRFWKFLEQYGLTAEEKLKGFVKVFVRNEND